MHISDKAGFGIFGGVLLAGGFLAGTFMPRAQPAPPPHVQRTPAKSGGSFYDIGQNRQKLDEYLQSRATNRPHVAEVTQAPPQSGSPDHDKAIETAKGHYAAFLMKAAIAERTKLIPDAAEAVKEIRAMKKVLIEKGFNMDTDDGFIQGMTAIGVDAQGINKFINAINTLIEMKNPPPAKQLESQPMRELPIWPVNEADVMRPELA